MIHPVTLHPELRSTFLATSAGKEALSRLRWGGAGSVHSVYDEALNLVFPRGVVSVVPLSKGRGPINLVLAAGHPEPVFGQVMRGSEAVFEGGCLTIGDTLRIILEGARPYRSPTLFRRRFLGYGRIRGNISDAQKQILETGRLEGLGGILRSLTTGIDPNDADSPFVTAALPRVTSLTRELSQGNVVRSVVAAEGLLGLGVGLTPSGDDLLSGAFLALILGSKNGIEGPPNIGEVGAKVALLATNRTTLLGRTYLELASRGEGNEVVVRFIRELFTGRKGALSRSLSELVEFGATSGTDIATGAIIGAKVLLGDLVAAS